MNLPLIIFAVIAALALVSFLIIRNNKDEIKFERKLDNDYPKPRHAEDENDMNEYTD